MPAPHALCCGMPASLTMQRGSFVGVMAYTCLIDAASAVEPWQAGLMPVLHERNSNSPALLKA